MASAVLRPFADDDLFDAELGAESDGDENIDCTERDGRTRDWADNNSDGEAANSSSDEEAREKRRRVQKKREAKKKSPKPRKAKKAERFSMYSETQRMVRESKVSLPYHVPKAPSISKFLERVPLTDFKEAQGTRIIQKTVELSDPHDHDSSEILVDRDKKDNNNCEISCSTPLHGDTASPNVFNGVKVLKAVTPKLSAATDPFFIDMESPTKQKPVVKSGIQNLRERFIKHTSKPPEKSVKTVEVVESKGSETPSETKPTPKGTMCTPIISDDMLKAATPGTRLQLLKEELQAKMRVRRAENRKVQESQRKLDNEDISEEEEEEEEEDTTDEEDDSDFELRKWNEDNDKKQKGGNTDLDEGNQEENVFLDVEAEESDAGNNYDDGWDIDSGSDGDISDDGEGDDRNSVSGDSLTYKRKAKRKLKELKLSKIDNEEKTMDLFGDSRSHSDAKIDSNDTFPRNDKEEFANEEPASRLCLRLDSVEDDDESHFSFPNSPSSSRNKTKSSFGVQKAMTDISEVSQESSVGCAAGSEFGESVNSLDASSDSSRIQAAQEKDSASKKTPELYSSFSKLRNLIGMPASQDNPSLRKPGKLSQLTLPVEDSQDLFDDTEDSNFKQRENKASAMSPNDFHFSLDEDTQFTQILNTQGFINSNKKSKSKASKDFDNKIDSSPQLDMKELLGLCSGRFSDGEDSTTTKNTRQSNKVQECPRGALFSTQSKEDNFDELLGLCSGKFTDDEVDNLASEEKLEGDTDIREKGERSKGVKEDGVDGDDDDDEREVEEEEEEDQDYFGEKTDKEDESDPEEMILNRKYGKKYGSKKSIFEKRNFLEEEAELSGSDIGSDEDEDIATDDDELEEDSGDEELPSEEELQKQINKVHMKSMHDQDNADLRAVKEMFLPDGDLFTDGQGRTRHFRWKGIDENSQLSLFGSKEMWGNEDEINTELISEEEIQRRKERYERETFIREEMDKHKSHILDIDDSSQDILSKIKDTTSQLPDAPISKPQSIIVDPKSNVTPVIKKKTSSKGSFLKHSKNTLSRLSSLTSNTVNASASARGFVFQTVSPSGKNIPNAKKIQRANSMIDQPASKKPRLDRSMSDSNSVFSML
ncbi:claspin-like [Acropora millepora]|uniref:claspin-like n=1 Tax=Acropora millepora TaxID=45264 RepID=UPI001CF21B4A|nr:claspin-like [Acropora millepora]